MASAVQVSTHSRLKAAELYGVLFILIGIVSTHSRPKAAAASSWLPFSWSERFNTQPPEGGWNDENSSHEVPFAFQHTAARRRLLTVLTVNCIYAWFQHTAARRRLVLHCVQVRSKLPFQHTAARRRLGLSQKPCSIRFRSPDFAKPPRKA